MNLRAVLLLAASVAFAAAAPASVQAQQPGVRVTFTDGRVSVIAENATVLDILREWSRVGGSTFVRAEQIPSTERLTLRLENVTETRALEVLLRSAAGYMAGPRKPAGLSTIGTVVIMPVSIAASVPQGPAAMQPIPDVTANNDAFVQMTRPDNDGPTQRQTPPPYPMPNPQNVANAPAPQTAPGSSIGQASPLGGTTTQTVPGLGAVTSSQPGVIIPNARPGGKPAPPTPTQPVTRPGGGG